MDQFKLGDRIWICDLDNLRFIDVTIEDVLIFKHNLFWLKGVKDLSFDVVDRANLAAGFLESGVVRVLNDRYEEIGNFRVTKAYSKIKNENYTIDLELTSLNNDNWLEDGF